MDGQQQENRPVTTAARASATMLCVTLISVVLGGCAAKGVKPGGGAIGHVLRQTDGTTTSSAPTHEDSDVATYGVSNGQLEVWGQKLNNSKFDFPVVVNPAVEHWIGYFTGKGRKYFEKYLERSRYFIPVISKILKSHNMPQDLVYLAMIESGFNNSAKSHAKAVGPWQFIRQTGQRYGMHIDYWLDERRDTRKSTLAAIGYLKDLYQEFGAWELAAAGYNAGENKVRRAIAKYHANDFWVIARHRFFRRETRDYVPKIMAAAIITKNAEQFGFKNPFTNKAPNPTIALVSDTEQSETASVDAEEPTPKELGEPAPNQEDTTEDLAEQRVEEKEEPSEEEELAESDALELDEENHAIVSQSPLPAISPSVYMVANPNEQIIEFEIKGPADLFAISKASGLPYSTIKMLNPELLRWCTPPYMKTYRVKLPRSIKERFLATYNDSSFDRKVEFLRYKIRKGDTISRVARRFGVERDAIRELNKMGRKQNWLRAGSYLTLPVPTGYKRVIASMYDDKPVYKKSRRKRYRKRSTRSRRSNSSRTSTHYRLKPNPAKAGG